MFKLKFSMILLSIALFSPLPTLADSDWGISPNFPASSSPSTPSIPAFTLNWSHSSFFGTSGYETANPDNQPEQGAESLHMDSLLLATMDSNWIYNLQFINETSVNSENFNGVFSNPNDWLIQAYLQTTQQNKWSVTLATLHYLNIANEAKLSDLSYTSNSPLLPKAMSAALLLIALIGWNLARRCQNQPSLANAPSNQRQP